MRIDFQFNSFLEQEEEINHQHMLLFVGGAVFQWNSLFLFISLWNLIVFDFENVMMQLWHIFEWFKILVSLWQCSFYQFARTKIQMKSFKNSSQFQPISEFIVYNVRVLDSTYIPNCYAEISNVFGNRAFFVGNWDDRKQNNLKWCEFFESEPLMSVKIDQRSLRIRKCSPTDY